MIVAESSAAWQNASDLVEKGEIVVFPTDTVYGVGCNPYDVTAIGKVYQAKSRSHLKALPLLLSDVDVFGKVSIGTNKLVEALGKAFWPGALTVVVAKASVLPDALGSETTIAVRVPDHDALRSFIRLCGGAIAATSANISGEPDALDAQQAHAYLGEYTRIIIDGGVTRGGISSTVVDCTGPKPSILRVGAISAECINNVLRANEALNG